MMGFIGLCISALVLLHSESALPLSLHASLDDPESIKMTYDEKTCTLMKLLSVKSKLAAVF